MRRALPRRSVLRCLRHDSLIPTTTATRRFSSASSSPHPSPAFLSQFEQTAGPLPAHLLHPPPSFPRPPPSVITHSVTRLPTGITRILLDIAVTDTPPPPPPPSTPTPSDDAALEAQWRARRLQRRSPSSPSPPISTSSGPSSPPLPPFSSSIQQQQREGVDWVPCVLLVPPRPSSSPRSSSPRFPALLCLHQTTVPPTLGKSEPTTPGSPLSYAYELTTRGYVTLSPDYPAFGSYHPSLSSLYSSYSSVTAKAIANNLLCVDLLSHYPLVHPAHIGAIGHSLGASSLLFTALYDPRLTSLVSSAGFTAHREYAERSRWHVAGAEVGEEEVREGTAYVGDMRGWARRDKYMPWVEERWGNDWRRMPWTWAQLIGELVKGGRKLFVSAPKRDLIFPWEGVRDTVREVREGMVDEEEAEGENRLVVVHPEGGHEFPADVRLQAYDWLDRAMKRGTEGEVEEEAEPVHGMGRSW